MAEDIRGLYLPEDKEQGIFLQQDGFMDKEQILVKDLAQCHRPLNLKWSWDRILRSCFIKQADVLQGIYLFRDEFDKDTIARNFRFYEQRTVHESSLSPCVHSILAVEIGDMEKAEEMYHRAARLDLDDYNHEIEEGLHITSMAGSWLSVVEGFGGMAHRNGQLHLNPHLPRGWERLRFKILYRGSLLTITATQSGVDVTNSSDKRVTVVVRGEEKTV